MKEESDEKMSQIEAVYFLLLPPPLARIITSLMKMFSVSM